MSSRETALYHHSIYADVRNSDDVTHTEGEFQPPTSSNSSSGGGGGGGDSSSSSYPSSSGADPASSFSHSATPAAVVNFHEPMETIAVTKKKKKKKKKDKSSRPSMSDIDSLVTGLDNGGAGGGVEVSYPTTGSRASSAASESPPPLSSGSGGSGGSGSAISADPSSFSASLYVKMNVQPHCCNPTGVCYYDARIGSELLSSPDYCMLTCALNCLFIFYGVIYFFKGTAISPRLLQQPYPAPYPRPQLLLGF